MAEGEVVPGAGSAWGWGDAPSTGVGSGTGGRLGNSGMSDVVGDRSASAAACSVRDPVGVVSGASSAKAPGGDGGEPESCWGSGEEDTPAGACATASVGVVGVCSASDGKGARGCSMSTCPPDPAAWSTSVALCCSAVGGGLGRSKDVLRRRYTAAPVPTTKIIRTPMPRRFCRVLVSCVRNFVSGYSREGSLCSSGFGAVPSPCAASGGCRSVLGGWVLSGMAIGGG